MIATVFIVIFGSFDNLRPSHIIDGKPVTVDMASIIEILMLSAAALILLFTKANGIKAAQGLFGRNAGRCRDLRYRLDG